MSKPKRCDWCGEGIAADEVRVKLPVRYEGPAMTYHATCYCRVFAGDCLRAIVSDDYETGVGCALARVLNTLGFVHDEEDED